MRRAIFALLLLLLLPFSARAHITGQTGYAAVTVQGHTVHYVLTLTTDSVEAAGLAADALPSVVARQVAIFANGTQCAAVPGTVQPPSPAHATFVITVDFACAGAVRSLSLTDDLFEVLGRDHHTLATIDWPAGHQQLLFESDHRSAQIALADEPAAAPAAGSAQASPLAFFRLGVEHILTGYDHILFLFALMLRGGRLASLLGIVTAFTIAHSLTLALAVLGVVVVPAQIVEPLIAASIAYVALENIFLRRAPSRRWLVSFIFGLVHGFGFAGALLELGLPVSGIVGSLLFFNLGVEAGQAMIVAALFPALVWLCRHAWERRAVAAMSAVVFIAAMGLVIQRVLFPEV
jgi:hypothetical protein